MDSSSLQQNPSTDHDSYSESKLMHDFETHLKLNQDHADRHATNQEQHSDDHSDDDEYEYYEEEEFSFFSGDASSVITSPVAAEDAFADGRIKPAVFPLFNRDLVFSRQDPDPMHAKNLPMQPPVKRVFVETTTNNEDHAGTTTTTSSPPGDDVIAGPYCEWSSRKAVEVSSPAAAKKSNSTGFSRIWRFKEFSKSNSDGRDAFVFLNHNNNNGAESTTGSTVKVVRKVKKGKTEGLEEYMRRSKGKKEDQRRRSYLPYRPELMGFFTTVSSGGLTKNVHPY